MTSRKNPKRETLLSDFSHQAMDYGLEFSRPTLSRFVKYEEELLRWNDKINLVSLKRPEELWTKHFLDSLSAAPFILHREGNLLDLGSGGGFPGLPLKLVFPEMKLFLLDRKSVV